MAAACHTDSPLTPAGSRGSPPRTILISFQLSGMASPLRAQSIRQHRTPATRRAAVYDLGPPAWDRVDAGRSHMYRFR